MSTSNTEDVKEKLKTGKFAGKKILMVEDDPYLREFYKRLLEREGVNIVVADDGLEGLEALQKEKPDLVLLDVMLPGITGIELLERVKEENIKHPKIVMLTDIEQPGVEEKARSLGAVDYLEKHEMNGPELKRKIEEILLVDD